MASEKMLLLFSAGFWFSSMVSEEILLLFSAGFWVLGKLTQTRLYRIFAYNLFNNFKYSLFVLEYFALIFSGYL